MWNIFSPPVSCGDGEELDWLPQRRETRDPVPIAFRRDFSQHNRYAFQPVHPRVPHPQGEEQLLYMLPGKVCGGVIQ